MGRNEPRGTFFQLLRIWSLLLVVVVFLALGIGCWAADLNECVRVHPLWYCLRK